MGQTTSNTVEPETEIPAKSHYELLGLSSGASEEDIKKAYRRKALELHPDRNHGKESAATALFAEIQTAYSVLSDPQERAWYDAHQAEFLSGGGGGDGDAHYERSVKVTTAEDIRGMCASRTSAFSDFSDSPKGFFTNVRELFERLAMEERIASVNVDWEPIDYPSFGSSKDDFQDVVKTFYSIWGGFSTAKTFAWKDLYRPSTEFDRRTRRAMEKENQKVREEAIREFNDAVRALVLFVRRRDPRYIATATTDAERQKTLREAAAVQAARARKSNAAKITEQTVPDWAQSRGDQEGDDYATEEGDEDEDGDEEPELEIWECVSCSKTFKSEGQYDAHERSKKHKQTVAKLKREMRNQHIELGLDSDPHEQPEQVTAEHEHGTDSIHGLSADIDEKLTYSQSNMEEEDTLSVPPSINQSSTQPKPPIETPAPGTNSATTTSSSSSSSSEEDEDEDDSYAPRPQVESRIQKQQTESGSPSAAANGTSTPFSNLDDRETATGTSTPSSERLKVGKAKEKRAKKAAKEAAGNSSGEKMGLLECAACEETFGSKNKLFEHIKKTGHARPPSETGSGTGRKGKKKS